jgi:hypothetical protein
MSGQHDFSDEAENGPDPIDPERMLRNIERIRMLPAALLVLAAGIVAAIMIYWVNLR